MQTFLHYFILKQEIVEKHDHDHVEPFFKISFLTVLYKSYLHIQLHVNISHFSQELEDLDYISSRDGTKFFKQVVTV